MFIYFNNTEKCKTFSKLLNNNEIKSCYLVGTDNSTKRNKVRESIINYELHAVCLCGVYNEGVSIDNL